MDYAKIIQQIASEVQTLFGQGRVADYIPELGKVSPKQFGLCLQLNDGASHGYGDSRSRFSIQSISKVFALILPKPYRFFLNTASSRTTKNGC